MDDRMTLKANLSYRNDGNSEPPRTDTVNRIAFPLSNSGRIIENMNGLPQVLNAYIFIHVIAGMPEDENNRCRGSLDLNIEYN